MSRSEIQSDVRKVVLYVAAHHPTTFFESLKTLLETITPGGEPRFRLVSHPELWGETIIVKFCNDPKGKPLLCVNDVQTDTLTTLPEFQGYSLTLVSGKLFDQFVGDKTKGFLVVKGVKTSKTPKRVQPFIQHLKEYRGGWWSNPLHYVGSIVNQAFRYYRPHGGVGWAPCNPHGASKASEHGKALKYIRDNLSADVRWVESHPYGRVLEVVVGKPIYFIFLYDEEQVSITDDLLRLIGSLKASDHKPLVISQSRVCYDNLLDLPPGLVVIETTPDRIPEYSPLYCYPKAVLKKNRQVISTHDSTDTVEPPPQFVI